MNNYWDEPAGKRRLKYPLLYKITIVFQLVFYKIGIAIHNPFSDECTPDFNCCASCGKKAFIKIARKGNSLL